MSDTEPDVEPKPVQDADAEGEPEPVTNLRAQTVPFQVS